MTNEEINIKILEVLKSYNAEINYVADENYLLGSNATWGLSSIESIEMIVKLENLFEIFIDEDIKTIADLKKRLIKE